MFLSIERWDLLVKMLENVLFDMIKIFVPHGDVWVGVGIRCLVVISVSPGLLLQRPLSGALRHAEICREF